VRAGDEHRQKALCKIPEEPAEIISILPGKNGESRKRFTPTAVEGGRNAPHPTATAAHLLKLIAAVLDKTIRWIGDYGMYTAWRGMFQPKEGIHVYDLCKIPEFFLRKLIE
jgi:hypothetical protein